MPTYTEVVDAICSQFYKNWIDSAPGGSAGIVGYTPEVRWWNQNYGKPPSTFQHWVHFSLRTFDERQKTFRGTDKEENYGERFESNGIVLVNLYFSKSTLQADHEEQLLEFARKQFIRPVLDSCVLFRGATKRQLAADEDFQRGLVTANWQYEDIIQG